MADTLPGELIVPTRDKIRDDYLRDYRIRNPNVDTGPNTQPYVDASAFADQMMPAYADAQTIANGTNDSTSGGDWLVLRGAALGQSKLPAAGGSGFVTITTSSGGATIFDGDEIKDAKSGLRFKCTATALYTNGAQVPITGIDTGPATNLKAGTVLQWSAPRPGCGANATVVTQSDGSGLSGGRDAETDELFRKRLQNLRANPPASGNDAAYQAAIESTPGIAIQKAFTYPAILGPGTTAFVFTLRPATAGGSRIPNGAQIAAVLARLVDMFPGDDGIFGATPVSSAVSFGYKVTWQKSAAGWADASPWPPFNNAVNNVKIDGSVSITALAFRLVLSGSTTTDPQIGQTIGFWDKTSGTFKRKRIKTVAVVISNQKWDITVDTTNNASDANYVPLANQWASPWSDSLDLVSPAVTGYVANNIGPGEMVASFSDPGIRQRRQPQSPDSWPSVISNRALRPVQDLTAVLDADLVSPAIPIASGVGTPGVDAALFEVGDLAVYQQ